MHGSGAAYNVFRHVSHHKLQRAAILQVTHAAIPSVLRNSSSCVFSAKASMLSAGMRLRSVPRWSTVPHGLATHCLKVLPVRLGCYIHKHHANTIPMGMLFQTIRRRPHCQFRQRVLSSSCPHVLPHVFRTHRLKPRSMATDHAALLLMHARKSRIPVGRGSAQIDSRSVPKAAVWVDYP